MQVIMLAAALLVSPSSGARSIVAAGQECTVIELRLDDVRLDVVVSAGFPNGDETFASMVSRAKPLAAINGAYFSTDTKKPIGDIVIGGRVLLQGRMGTALAIKKDQTVDILRVKFHRTMDWSQHETVLACGPALLLDGKVDVNPQIEGFTEAKIMQKHARMGVGYTKDRRLLMVHVKDGVTFPEFAQVMLQLGCYEAMNLDAGASLAMYYDGKTLQAPGRKLTNLLVAYRRSE
jgi:exopolysaccharide biosynthesis protein